MSDGFEPQDIEQPRLAIRRWGDGCFHPVEEEVPQGYIVDGILIPRDEVTQIIELHADESPSCPRRRAGDEPS